MRAEWNGVECQRLQDPGDGGWAFVKISKSQEEGKRQERKARMKKSRHVRLSTRDEDKKPGRAREISISPSPGRIRDGGDGSAIGRTRPSLVRPALCESLIGDR